MAAKTLATGLDAGAVTATAPYYERRGGGEGVSPSPLAYAAFTPPLAPAAVRLLVFFLKDDALHAACDAAVDALRAALPARAAFHASLPSGRHMTVFQTSHPQCLWPGVGTSSVPPPGAPTAGAVSAEVAAARALAAATRPPRLIAHSIVLAPSGTLVLLLTEGGGGEAGGVVASLRAAAAAALPGCPVRQPAIMHVTLGRVLTELRVEEAREAAAAAARAVAAARGLGFTPAALTHVCEATFATVQGPRVDAPWGHG
jgi:hypothetical protein